jgi:hypothetical protein
MTKKRKIILSIVAALLAVSAYGYFFGMQTGFAILVRQKRDPLMDIVPKPMTVGSCAEPVTKLEAFDYSFFVPWTDCSQPAWMIKTSFVAWACSGSNTTVACLVPEHHSPVFDARGKNPEYKQLMIKGLGLENAASANFHIYEKMLKVTSGNFSPFDSKREIAVKYMLFLMKELYMPNSRVIYSFEHGDIKGFQFGNPSVDRIIRLSIFDQMDRRVELDIGMRTNSPVRPTQADINTIITTFSSNP